MLHEIVHELALLVPGERLLGSRILPGEDLAEQCELECAGLAIDGRGANHEQRDRVIRAQAFESVFLLVGEYNSLGAFELVERLALWPGEKHLDHLGHPKIRTRILPHQLPASNFLRISHQVMLASHK